MVGPHCCLLAACSLFIKGRARFISAADEHVQGWTVQSPGCSSRERFHVAKSIPAASSQGTWSVREQETQNPGNVLPQQGSQSSAELKEQLRGQKSQTRPPKALIFVPVVLPGSSALPCSGIPANSPNGSPAVLVEIN